MASEIIELVGTKENVSNVFHCMTRLRFNLKDQSLANSEALKTVQGVQGVHIDGGEIQVIIGPSVNDVYEEVLKITELKRTEQIDENLDSKKGTDFSLKGIFNGIINAFSACMNPLVPCFVLIGTLNVITSLIGPGFFNLVSTDSNIYTNFYFAAQAITYFLPILVAITSAKHFKTNVYLVVIIACIMLYPDLVNLMASGVNYTVYGIPAAAVTYSATVIPIMMIAFVQSYVARLINRITPEVLKVILVPMGTVLIMLPIALCALGPLGNYIGMLLVQAIMWLRGVAGPIETMVVAAICPFLTAFGIGRPLFFVCMTTLLTTGSEFAYMPIAMVLNNFIVMGVSVGFAIKAKNAKNRQLGITCFAANFLGGVSEPALFGIVLPNKKTYLPIVVGGAISGLYLGIMNVGLYSFGASNFLGVLAFIGPNSSNLVHGLIATALAFVVTLAMMLLTYKEQETV